MAQHVPMKAPAHYLRVDLDDPGEAEYWQVVLDAPRRQLEAAIAAVGRDARDVQAYLREPTAGSAYACGASPFFHGHPGEGRDRS